LEKQHGGNVPPCHEEHYPDRRVGGFSTICSEIRSQLQPFPPSPGTAGPVDFPLV
jgi:hypothetical protein